LKASADDSAAGSLSGWEMGTKADGTRGDQDEKLTFCASLKFQ